MTPFQPTTQTSPLAVTATNQTLSLPATSGGVAGGMIQCMLTVIGSQTVWVAVNTTAVIPTSSAKSSFPILAGTQPVLTLPAGATLNVIAANTGSTLYVTQGFGA